MQNSARGLSLFLEDVVTVRKDVEKRMVLLVCNSCKNTMSAKHPAGSTKKHFRDVVGSSAHCEEIDASGGEDEGELVYDALRGGRY